MKSARVSPEVLLMTGNQENEYITYGYITYMYMYTKHFVREDRDV